MSRLLELYRREKQQKMKQKNIHGDNMKQEYNLSKMKRRKNPFAKQLKKQVTIRMGLDVIEYFKNMAEETGIPYQNLINLYLRDCMASQRKLSFKWVSKN